MIKNSIIKNVKDTTCQFITQKVGNLYKTGGYFHIPGFKIAIMAERDSSLVSKADALVFIKSILTQSNIAKTLGVSQSYVSKTLK